MAPRPCITSSRKRQKEREDKDDDDDDGDDSSTSTVSITFPRRYPRMGTNFQARVPRATATAMAAAAAAATTTTTYPLYNFVKRRELLLLEQKQQQQQRRPAPMKMSIDMPFRTVEEMMQTAEADALNAATSTTRSNVVSSTTVLGYEATTSTLLHRGDTTSSTKMSRVDDEPKENANTQRFVAADTCPLLTTMEDNNESSHNNNNNNKNNQESYTVVIVDQQHQQQQSATTPASTDIKEEELLEESSSSSSFPLPEQSLFAKNVLQWHRETTQTTTSTTTDTSSAADSSTSSTRPPLERERKSRYKRPRTPTLVETSATGGEETTKKTAFFPSFLPLPPPHKIQALCAVFDTNNEEENVDFLVTGVRRQRDGCVHNNHDSIETTTGSSSSSSSSCSVIQGRRTLEQDQLNVLIQLSAGQAAKTIRQAKRQRKKLLVEKQKHQQGDISSSSSNSSPSHAQAMTWRQRSLGIFQGIRGDYRTHPSEQEEAEDSVANNTTDSATNPLSEESLVVWKATLACGRAMLLQCQENKQSLLLSQVLSFVQNASHLPPIVVPDDEAAMSTDDDDDKEDNLTEENVATCMWSLLEACEHCRKVRAKLMDLWYYNDRINNQGVELEDVRKLLDSAKKCRIQMDELTEMQRQFDMVVEWQGRVDQIVNLDSPTAAASKMKNNSTDGTTTNEDDDELTILNDLAREAACTHGFRCKGLVLLHAKLEKANELRDRIRRWSVSCRADASSPDRMQGIKFFAALVRDVNRLKLTFPEATEMITFHQKAEAWVERANIAIRSRISLSEIKALIKRGAQMPLDLSEFLEKLKSRVSAAQAWLKNLNEHLPLPLKHGSSNSGDDDDDDGDQPLEGILPWMRSVRDALLDEYRITELHDLAVEGSRIPVEVDYVKLLQVELDARSWSIKAKKWIPSSVLTMPSSSSSSSTASSSDDEENSKRGRLEELREHLEKAEALRDRLLLSADDKKEWILEGEAELLGIVQAADDWFDKYKPFLDGDNRRSGGRSCLCMATLRQIAHEGNAIYANVGSATSKIAKILSLAEKWNDKHHGLLMRCQALKDSKNTIAPRATLQELKAAVHEASSEIAFDLDEAKDLESLVETVESWFDRAGLPCGSKKRPAGGGTRSKKTALTIHDLHSLIQEAAGLPIDAREHIRVLNTQLHALQDWQTQVAAHLDGVSAAFQSLHRAITEAYGEPKSFCRAKQQPGEKPLSDQCPAQSPETRNDAMVGVVAMSVEESKDDNKEVSPCDTEAACATGQGGNSGLDVANLTSRECHINILIKNLGNDAKQSGVVTPESDIAGLLERVSRWCFRSLKYLENQRDIFDKRFFGAFDRFLREGRDLISGKGSPMDQNDLWNAAASSWGSVISDQLERLNVLFTERDQFVDWCKEAEQLLSPEKKPISLEKLRIVAKQSHDFPSDNELVANIIGLQDKAEAWLEATRDMLKSPRKPTMHEVKCSVDEGEMLGLHNCNEIRTLRGGMKAARTWANKVKKCNLDVGTTSVKEVRGLIQEHGTLMIKMPEEIARLSQSLKNYCICRRPYEGFMVKCEECGDWFHGPCVGVSKSRNDKDEKYGCVRCSISRVFKACATTAAGVLRKWTSEKDLRKARQTETQKHQRKVRKESKDLEKCAAELESLQRELVALDLPPQAPLPLLNDGQVTASAAALPVFSAETDSMQSAAPTATAEPPPSTKTKQQLQRQIEKVSASMKRCELRISALSVSANERRNHQELENLQSTTLKRWCVRVRSSVLVPSSSQAADQSRPANDGTLSSAMVAAIREAEMLGLTMYQDVSIMENSFKCLSWCIRVMDLLSRQPKSSEIEAVVLQAATLNLKLPEDKAIRSLRSLMQRANAWQTRVTKVLAPVPGESNPYNLDELNDLARAADDIPLCMPLESRLLAVIDDNGARHCVCCGPSDGRLMVSCDRCHKWFHCHCVHVSKEAVEALEDGDEWICPPCLGNPPNAASLQVEKFQDKFDVEEEEDIEHDVAPKAPKADEMWPPFGLLGSEKAQEALGKVLVTIPDDCGPWDPPALSRPSALSVQQLPASQSVVPSVPATSQGVISTVTARQVAASAAPVRQSVVSSVPSRESAVPAIPPRQNVLPSVPSRQSDFSTVPTISAWPQPISNSHVYSAFPLTMMSSLPRYSSLNASTYMGNSIMLAGNGALQPAERKVNTSVPMADPSERAAAPSTMEMGMGHGSSAAYNTANRPTSRPASPPPPSETNLNDMTSTTVRDVMVAPVNNSNYN